jgi:hypothetical protein
MQKSKQQQEAALLMNSIYGKDKAVARGIASYQKRRENTKNILVSLGNPNPSERDIDRYISIKMRQVSNQRPKKALV